MGAAAAFRGALFLDPLVRFLDAMPQSLLPLLALALLAPAPAAAQAGPCGAPTPAGYDGPCYYGALPAFFDDFRYASGSTQGDVSRLREGDLFGPNRWMTREGEEVTRAWYRFNRNDHPVPGSITFHDGVMRLEIPRGWPASEFPRIMMLHTGATFESGTYFYRVRLSPHWDGQQVRQSAWAMSPELFKFDRFDHDPPQRYRIWSEIDFENENHFQGVRVDGRLVPDFNSRMSVGNHFGRLDQHRETTYALSSEGPVHFMEPRGALARDGFARHPRNEAAPRVDDWSNRWLDLLIHVDPDTRTTTYWMHPAQPDPELEVVARRPVIIDELFYPRRPMHFAFSLHWLAPQGSLAENLWMEVDWVYYSPISGLTVDDISSQVTYLRRRAASRVSTTGGPLFVDHLKPLRLTLDGPDVIACGELGTWQMVVNRAGFVQATMRVRTVSTTGSVSPWRSHYDFEISMEPRDEVRAIELEASVQDLWRPHGVVSEPTTGWNIPHPGNERVTTTRRIEVAC